MKPCNFRWLLPAALVLSARLEAAPPPAAVGFDHPDCPARARLPAHATGSPADDIRGLRPGAPLDTSIQYLECLDPQASYKRETSFNDDPLFVSRDRYYGRQVRTHVQLQAAAAQTPATSNEPISKVDFQLSSFGEPGREIVYFIEQTQSFDRDTQPTLRTVLDSLQQKYGQPASVIDPYKQFIGGVQQPARSGYWRGAWAWNAAGQPAALQRTDIPSSFSCVDGPEGLGGSPEGVGAGPPCTLTIRATVLGDGALVTRLTVAISRPAAHAAAVRDADARWTAEAVEKAKDRKPAL